MRKRGCQMSEAEGMACHVGEAPKSLSASDTAVCGSAHHRSYASIRLILGPSPRHH